MNMKIFHQSVFDRWTLEDKSVQAVITSPPYWSKRRYDIPDVIVGGDNECEHEFVESKDKMLNLQSGNPEFQRKWRKEATQVINNGAFCIHCGAWKGQHGLEPDFRMYIEHVRLWAKEVWRVLKDDGVFFLNLGDTFCSSGGPTRHWGYSDVKYQNGRNIDFIEPASLKQTVKPKCKVLIPHRVAIALIDDGWICRNDIVWRKPDALPESVKDRFSVKFEYIFMFVKQTKYYFDLEAVKVSCKDESVRRFFGGTSENNKYAKSHGEIHSPQSINKPKPNRLKEYMEGKLEPPEGKNPGDVWELATQPSHYPHYAMWPETLVERMVLCSTRPGDSVLDPFCGSGTTLVVAERLNRVGIGIDLGYEDIQKDRCSNIQKQLFV